jgi:hypothetical protein
MTRRARRQGGLSRRHFLTGLGGITLALPWLEKLNGVARAQSAAAGPKRVIVMAYEMGTPGGEFRPSATGSSFTLPYVTAPLDPFKDRCLFVTAIDHTMLGAGGNGFVFGHPAKKEAALTGTLTTGAFPTANTNQLSEVRADATTDGTANGPSVEQIIGEALRVNQPLPSVNLGVDGDAGLATWGAPGPSANSNFFFEGAANPITLSLHPSQAFDALFAGLVDTAPSAQDLALERLRARNKSVLDAVRASFNDLKQGLNTADRTRLEDHAARLRQLEIDVQLSATCSVPTGIAMQTDYSGFKMDALAPLQNRILAHAMACDMAPVGRIEYVNQQNPRFGVAGLDSALDGAANYDWHAMVHGDPLPGTTVYMRPGRDDVPIPYDTRLLDGYRFFVAQFAALLAELDAIPEGPDGTALDNTLLILASDLGEGLGHGHMKMNYVLAGNLGGARTGYHFDAGPSGMPYAIGGGYYYTDSAYNVNQLLNSMLDMAGVADGGGNPVTMGLQGWIEDRGIARRIDGLF